MTDEERRQYQREYFREYKKKNRQKYDRMPSVRRNYEANYADFIMKQVEITEERRRWGE